MSGETSKANPVSYKPAGTNTPASTDVVRPRQRIIQGFLLIWLDAGFDQSNEDYQNISLQLHNVVNEMKIFTEPDECIDYLTDTDQVKAVLIIEDRLGQQILPLIYAICQLDAVYVFCHTKSPHEQWATVGKVKGIHTEMTPICQSLQQMVEQFNQDSIAVSFIAIGEAVPRENLNELEPSFMYTQLFNEILLEMKYDEQSIKKFIAYCRNGDHGSPTNITRFENEYHPQSAVW